MASRPDAGDALLRTSVHHLLRAGVGLSAILMAAGLAAAAAGADVGVKSIRAGVLVLMFTPVIRVAFIAASAAWERDWKFLGISASVLVLLGLGIALGVTH